MIIVFDNTMGLCM